MRDRLFTGNRNRVSFKNVKGLDEVTSKRAKARRAPDCTPDPEPEVPNYKLSLAEIRERRFQKWQEKQRKKLWNY